jgi:hypothetical protein
MRKTNKKAPSLRRAFGASWRTISRDLFDRYHPERHYMRGPGPMWQEKNGQTSAPQGHEFPASTMTAMHA